ncbi:MAG: serine hydrolase [Polyangiaceae bacterium]|nr:serine hydrolase [Polyangiaceae bacterium]MCL4752748.1 serine hydrolase [Myxococcales bacterium]
MTLTERLEELCRRFAGVAGFAALHLDSGESLGIRAEESFPTASAIKVFVLHTLFAKAAAGELSLEERRTLPSERTLGSGVLLHLGPGLAPSLGDLATLMMMVSDNLATNLLIDELGVAAINAQIRAAGLGHTSLRGRIDFSRLSSDKTALGVSTPADLARYFARLRKGELLGSPWAERLLDVMRIQKYIEPLRRQLPADPYAREFGEPEPVWVASKTGSLSGVRSEAGLVHTPKAEWSIAVMTRDVRDTRVTSDNEALRLIAEVSRAVYDAWG